MPHACLCLLSPQFKQADGYLERLVMLKPNDVESARLLAETKAQEGDYSAAATKYVAALKISPDNLELLRGYIVRESTRRRLESDRCWLESTPCRLESTPCSLESTLCSLESTSCSLASTPCVYKSTPLRP
jgi:tetratricopeptide (TPR) repeat protein